MFEKVNCFFEGLFSRLLKKPVSRRIVMEPQLRVDGSGKIHVYRVPTNADEKDHDRADA